MHFTLLVAGALLPAELAVALSTPLDAPNLKARLACARRTARSESSADGNAHLDWLAQQLFGQTATAPTAPYSFAHLAGVAAPAFVWHADPVHMEVARDHLVAQELEADARVREESRQLMHVANQLASNMSCSFVCAGDRWFLQSEQDWVIQTVPLSAAIETPVALPTGADTRIWTRLHNEIQMAWHAHVLNEAREADRLPSINGIWLHGGGRWRPLAPMAYTHVLSDEPAWQGAARAAGARSAPLNADVVDEALLVVDDAVLPKRRGDWAAWLNAMATLDHRLATHRFDAIDIVLAGNTVRTFESRPSDRYKPWRRRALAEALTE